MTDEENAAYDALPEVVTIYRDEKRSWISDE
jgi:hypothetical protein